MGRVEEEVIDGLVRADRMANVIAQEPKYVREDIASLVTDNQLPGSFGDLIKQSVAIVEAHKEFEGSNVVSMMGRR